MYSSTGEDQRKGKRRRIYQRSNLGDGKNKKEVLKWVYKSKSKKVDFYV